MRQEKKVKMGKMRQEKKVKMGRKIRKNVKKKIKKEGGKLEMQSEK